jgi:MraZ protein
VFNGRFDHSIDEKGRVSIPARFREVLQREGHDQLYITNIFFQREPCLDLYPPDEWEKLNARLSERGRFDPQMQAFETFYIAGAHDVPVDRQGRILVPTKLREHAKLGREVTFSARRDHFQLWDRKLLAKVLKATEEQMMDPEFFGKLGL